MPINTKHSKDTHQADFVHTAKSGGIANRDKEEDEKGGKGFEANICVYDALFIHSDGSFSYMK